MFHQFYSSETTLMFHVEAFVSTKKMTGRKLEQTGFWIRMGNLICPKCPGATFFQCPFTPSAPLLHAHLPQRLFASKHICPGANLPSCLLCQCPFPPSSHLHSACSPFIPRAHFYWFPLPLLPISPVFIFLNALWSHTKTFVPMRSHRVL